MWLPPSIPSSPPGSPAPPQVAAQSPPPTQPRERMAGTEFNRHHQQPPGKLGKVDTIIPVTVSGEQAQGRSLLLLREGSWRCQRPTGPGPSLASAMVRSLQRTAWRLPVKGRQEEAETTRVAGGTIEVTSPPPNCPSPSPAPAKGSCLCTYEWFPAALYREISLNNGVNRKEMGEVGRRGPGSSGGVGEGVGLG